MRPKRKMAEDPTSAQGSAKLRATSKEELEQIVMQLHAQSVLDRALWVAVEEAFDTHATRIEALSHQDLQWNDDFAKTFDGIQKSMDQLEAKMNGHIGQVITDLTATVRKAESELIIVIKETDGEFGRFRKDIKERVDETREAFKIVEQEFKALKENTKLMEEVLKRGYQVDPPSGLFVGAATAVHEMSPQKPPAVSAASAASPAATATTSAQAIPSDSSRLLAAADPWAASAAAVAAAAVQTADASPVTAYMGPAPWAAYVAPAAAAVASGPHSTVPVT